MADTTDGCYVRELGPDQYAWGAVTELWIGVFNAGVEDTREAARAKAEAAYLEFHQGLPPIGKNHAELAAYLERVAAASPPLEKRSYPAPLADS